MLVAECGEHVKYCRKKEKARYRDMGGFPVAEGSFHRGQVLVDVSAEDPAGCGSDEQPSGQAGKPVIDQTSVAELVWKTGVEEDEDQSDETQHDMY